MIINTIYLRNLISGVIERNPRVTNSSLAKVVEANIVNFKGHIRISDCDVHSFRSDGYEGIRKRAKIIYLSPYGVFFNLLVSIKRIFFGAVFSPSNRNGDLRFDLAQGRRMTIFCVLDGSEAEAVIETDQKPLFARIYKMVMTIC